MSGKTENLQPSDAVDPEGGFTKSPSPELAPEAQRALAEAQARRAEADAEAKARPAEEGGRGGPDPARYGDWEINGRAIDF